MGEVEDLNTKAARLWLEFLQAQAKAAASAAEKLPKWRVPGPLCRQSTGRSRERREHGRSGSPG